MEESNLERSVRERLVTAGLNELNEHGLAGFSLRRVAISAQVSCAAPYRHFKDKNELIGAIIEYIASKWKLLCVEIERAFSDDPKRLIIELCTSNLRFWLANGAFRSVLMTEWQDNAAFAAAMMDFDSSTDLAISRYLTALGADPATVAERQYAIRALVYGSVMLVTQGREVNSDATVAIFRRKIEGQLEI